MSPAAGTSRRFWVWARVLGGAAILAVLVWRLGTGPFLDGVRSISAWSLAAAAGIAMVTTVCCAWRWILVARGLGVDLPLPAAVAAYYRSQFLNTVLPGGVLGDVHRGVSHGRDVGDVSRGLRAVAWERSSGQVVQAALSVIVLLVLPSPVRSAMPLVAAAVVVGALGAVLLGRVLPHDGPSWWARTLQTAGADIREGLLARRAWPGIVLTSAAVVVGSTAMFLIAARTAGSTESLARMLPLAMLVLLATAVPANVAGWGPREGMAAWAFGAAGLSADRGVATAAVFGVMVFVASLPGAVVLVATSLRRRARRADPQGQAEWRVPAAAEPKGAVRG
jgi:glycosyltransferase 2 family protein